MKEFLRHTKMMLDFFGPIYYNDKMLISYRCLGCSHLGLYMKLAKRMGVGAGSTMYCVLATCQVEFYLPSCELTSRATM